MTRILGVLGGMGPAASSEFMKVITERYQADRDQDHPIIYLLSDPTIPDRCEAAFGKGESPVPALKKNLNKLTDWGADLLAIPCNTAHIFVDKFRHELKVPLIHIVEETVKNAIKNAPEGAWILATTSTINSKQYDREAAKYNYKLYTPSEEIKEEVQDIIYDVKRGDTTIAGQKMRSVVKRLRCEKNIPFIMACTDLPLAYREAGLPEENAVSSLNSLADACIVAIKENK